MSGKYDWIRKAKISVGSKGRKSRVIRRAASRANKGNTINLAPSRGMKMGRGTFPNKLLTHVDYTSQYAWTAAFGTLTNFDNLNLNSIYDPDASIGGNSASMFSTLMSIYRSYRIYAVKVELEVFPQSNTPDLDVAIWYLGDEAAPSTNRTNGVYTNYAPGAIPQNIALKTICSGQHSLYPIKLKRFYDFRKIVGKRLMSDNDYTGSLTSNPTKVLIGQIGCAPVDGATAPNVDARVHVRFYVQFENLITEQEVTEG